MSIQKPTKTSLSDGLRFKMLRWTSQGTKGEHPASQSRRRQASICLWLDCLLLRARCSRSRPARDHVCPEPRSSLLCSGSFPPSLFTTHTPKAWLRVPFTRGQSLVRKWMARLHGQASLWRPAGGVHPRARRAHVQSGAPNLRSIPPHPQDRVGVPDSSSATCLNPPTTRSEQYAFSEPYTVALSSDPPHLASRTRGSR